MPDWKQEVRLRLAPLNLPVLREASIVEEVAAYLEDCHAEFLANGASPEDAHQRTLEQLGSNEVLARELQRATLEASSQHVVLGTNRRTNVISDLWHDLRYGARMLWKHRGMTSVIVLSLALGIGANTAIFSLIDTVLLKTLPVDDPEQLVFIQNVGTRRPDGGAPPYPCFERFRDQNRFFTAMSAFTGYDPQLKIDGRVEEVRGQRVSGNYFSLLGVRAILGRTLTPADDAGEQGGPDGLVGVISHQYWTGRFGREPSVIGKVVYLGDQPVTIVGVMPPEFSGMVPGERFDITLPISSAGRSLAQKEFWWFRAVGRLKPGASVEQARAELDGIFQTYMDEIAFSAEARRTTFTGIDLRPAGKGMNELRQEFAQPLKALMAIVALVLLIACGNVANLLLAKATGRRREFAGRLALGASRSRLLRQVLTESLLLVLGGALAGLILARWGTAVFVHFFVPARNRIFLDVPLDYRILAFTAAVALITGLIFGLAPAFSATRVDLNTVLKERDASGRVRNVFGKSLVIGQVALSLLLLVGAGLFVRTLHNLNTLDPGFRPAGVLTMRISPPNSVVQADRFASFWNETLQQVERVAGVRSVSLTTLSPLDGNDRGVAIVVSGFTERSNEDRGIRMNQVTPRYFETFGIPVLQGRSFTEADDETAPKVVLLNEAAARFYFGEKSPLGAHVSFPQRTGISPQYEIVGIVKDSRYENLRSPDTRLMYLPLKQARDRLVRLMLAVRTEGDPMQLSEPVAGELRQADPDTLITSIATLNERVSASLIKERLIATLSLFFGLLALLLASIGLYGVMSYDVARRTNEIGIRMALGAEAKRVVRLVLRQTLLWVVLGLGIGWCATLATAHLLQSLLFGLTPRDPLTAGAAALVLLVVAGIAAFLPARRASRIDPLVALRHG